MPQTPPPLQSATQSGDPPTSAANIALTIVIWIVWLGVTLVADLFGFLMFAFADSPGSADAAKLMIVPAFGWFAFTFVAGAILLILPRRAWRIVLAFVLAVSPPFVIFAGYNLLAGANVSPTSTGPAPAPAPAVQTPPGGFVPKFTPPEQPDFRQYFPTTAPTQPAATTQP